MILLVTCLQPAFLCKLHLNFCRYMHFPSGHKEIKNVTGQEVCRSCLEAKSHMALKSRAICVCGGRGDMVAKGIRTDLSALMLQKQVKSDWPDGSLLLYSLRMSSFHGYLVLAKWAVFTLWSLYFGLKKRARHTWEM